MFICFQLWADIAHNLIVYWLCLHFPRSSFLSVFNFTQNIILCHDDEPEIMIYSAKYYVNIYHILSLGPNALFGIATSELPPLHTHPVHIFVNSLWYYGIILLAHIHKQLNSIPLHWFMGTYLIFLHTNIRPWFTVSNVQHGELSRDFLNGRIQWLSTASVWFIGSHQQKHMYQNGLIPNILI